MGLICMIVLINRDDELYYALLPLPLEKKGLCVHAVDVDIYFTKHHNMSDKARHCSSDPLFMLVMFCCWTPLSGSTVTPPGFWRFTLNLLSAPQYSDIQKREAG